MTKTKLNFRFHNPNTAEETAEYLAAIFFEVSRVKLDEVMRGRLEGSGESEERVGIEGSEERVGIEESEGSEERGGIDGDGRLFIPVISGQVHWQL